jgi:hypothetical protein
MESGAWLNVAAKERRAMRRQCAIAALLALVLMIATAPDLPVSAGKHQKPLAYPQFGPFFSIHQGDTKGNYEPAVAYSPNRNEYVVVWRTDQDYNTWDIWARRVGADGSLKGPSAFCVATSASMQRSEPAVAYNPVRDEYLVVYTYCDDSDPMNEIYDIKATVVKGDLSGKDSEYDIYQGSGDQWRPKVAYNTQDDEYVVVWGNHWASGVHDIYAQRLHSDGSLFPSFVTIATDPTELRSIPDVAYNAARNEYLIAYHYFASSISINGDIRGKVVSANLGTLGTERHICENLDDQDSLAVAAGPDEYLVTWEDENTVSGYDDIFARRLSGNGGVPLGPADGFPVGQFSWGSCFLPDVDYGWIHGYVVTWHTYDTTYLEDLYVHQVHVGSDGVQGVAGMSRGEGSQRNSAIACAPPGDCLKVNEDDLDWTTWTQGDYEIRGSFLRAWRQHLPLGLRNY